MRTSILKIALLTSTLAACGTQHGAGSQTASHGGISSGGLPPLCAIQSGDLSGRSYAGSGLTIEFFTASTAAYKEAGSDIKYLVTYTARPDCFVTLTDSSVPALRNGRQFVMRYDLSQLTDWQDGSIVLTAH